MQVDITVPGPQGPRGEQGFASIVPVDDIAALENLAVDELVTGSLAWVESVLDEWRLERDSSLVVDHISIASVFGETTSRWVRKNIPHPSWLAETEWHWDYDSGDDENSGTSELTALKTHAEYQRRTGWRLFGPDETWTFHSDHPTTDQVVINAAGFGGRAVKILGDADVVRVGQFSGGFVAADAATNEYWLLHDASVSDWTPYVGKFIRFTSGSFAGDAFAIVLEDASDVGPGWVRVAQPYERLTEAFNDQARYTPTGTETYEIQDLTWIQNIVLNHQPSAIQASPSPTSLPVVFDNVKLPDTATIGFWDPSFAFARNCEIPNYGQLRSRFYSSNTLFTGDFWVPGVGAKSQHQGPVIMAGVAFIEGEIFFDDFPIFWRTLVGGFLDSATGPSWWHFHGGVVFDNCSALAQGLLQAFRTEFVIVGTVWGRNNTGDLFHLHPSTRVFEQTLTVYVEFSGNFATINNRTSLPAFDYATQTFSPLRSTTYANYVADVSSGGFGRTMYDPATLCGIWRTES